MDTISRLQHAYQTMLSTCLGTQCPLCGNATHMGTICSPCQSDLLHKAPGCRFCQTPVHALGLICGACLQRRQYYDQLISVSDFAGPWADCVKAFKYRAGLSLARPMSDMLIQRLRQTQAHNFSWAGWQVMGMPMAQRRRWQRGYNQAEILAKRVAQGLGANYQQVAQRIKHTPALEKQTRQERARTMRSVFTAPAIGGSWLIIDDVFTTGASINELARTLRAQGARYIIIATLARTPTNEDSRYNWLGQVFHGTPDATDETNSPPLNAKT